MPTEALKEQKTISEKSSRISVCVRITGRVQGVWYRGWTAEEATAKGLSGWVVNRNDGSVEALFSGTNDNVQSMLSACKNGPSLAEVSNITEISYDKNTMPEYHEGMFYKAVNY
jgi:acylphosphatase